MLREHSVWYAVNSGVLLASYVVLRLLLFPYLAYLV
jgi:hypothetical protein